jgi:AcrR family transcriptional regulator
VVTKPRQRRGRAPLSKERVLAAAVGLADAGGIASLSMRKLAQELGVEAMSLYHHVAGKKAILDGMLDIVYREIEVPEVDGDWRVALRRVAISTHDALLRHPWACGLIMSTSNLSEMRLGHMDTVLGRFRDAGFSEMLIDQAYHALDSYIVGFTLWQLPYLALATERPDFARDFYEEIDRGRFPNLVDHIEYHLDPPAGANAFEFGLDLLLDGLDRLRDSR